jgi:carboxylesterase type B
LPTPASIWTVVHASDANGLVTITQMQPIAAVGSDQDAGADFGHSAPANSIANDCELYRIPDAASPLEKGLFGRAIQLAGGVKARGERPRVRSDWMAVERGISVSRL